MRKIVFLHRIRYTKNKISIADFSIWEGCGDMAPALQKELSTITLEQYEILPDDQRVEVFDGFVYDMAGPSQVHQELSALLLNKFMNFYYYKNYGVREYWIVDPQRKIVTVNYFEGDNVAVQYSFNSVVKVNIYEDLYIDFSEMVKMF